MRGRSKLALASVGGHVTPTLCPDVVSKRPIQLPTPTKVQMRSSVRLATAAVLLSLACSDGDPTGPLPPTGDQFTLSQAQYDAMVDRAEEMADANPGNASLRSFVDSTLQALQAGV